MVKGGGAALLREKIVDSTSKKLVIIVDEKKLAKTLGGPQPIPVEIVPFGYSSTVAKIRKISEKAVLREAAGKVGPVITDNGNLIADVFFRSLRRPEIVHEKLKNIPGVIEPDYESGALAPLSGSDQTEPPRQKGRRRVYC